MSENLEEQVKLAIQLLLPYQTMMDRQSPEYTIHQLRERFLELDESYVLNDFTFGLRLLLEKKYLRRLNDERLELTPPGKEWFTEQLPA